MILHITLPCLKLGFSKCLMCYVFLPRIHKCVFFSLVLINLLNLMALMPVAQQEPELQNKHLPIIWLMSCRLLHLFPCEIVSMGQWNLRVRGVTPSKATQGRFYSTLFLKCRTHFLDFFFPALEPVLSTHSQLNIQKSHSSPENTCIF